MEQRTRIHGGASTQNSGFINETWKKLNMDDKLNVRIMYCVEDEFPPKFKFGDTLPNVKELRENWKVLPDWVYENLAEDGINLEYAKS